MDTDAGVTARKLATPEAGNENRKLIMHNLKFAAETWNGLLAGNSSP